MPDYLGLIDGEKVAVEIVTLFSKIVFVSIPSLSTLYCTVSSPNQSLA